MKNVIAILTACLLVITTLTGQDWSTTQLKDFASIDFPKQPDKNTIQNNTIYLYSDSSGIYMVQVKDLTAQQTLLTNSSQFYQKFIEGAIATSKGKLVAQKEIEIGGLKGMEIKVTVENEEKLPDTRYTKMVLVNNYLISANFWTNSAIQNDAVTNKDYFFVSLSVKDDK